MDKTIQSVSQAGAKFFEDTFLYELPYSLRFGRISKTLRRAGKLSTGRRGGYAGYHEPVSIIVVQERMIT